MWCISFVRVLADNLITGVVSRIYAVIETCLRWITHPLFLYSDVRSERKYPPPIHDPILTKSATYLAKKIRAGEIKSEDVIKAYVRRLNEVNSYLNAVVDERFEEALKEARRVDELVASRMKTVEQLENDTPLLGVPFTVKESCKLKGMTFCVGSLLRKGVRASEDGKAVRNMRLAGAIPVAVTNTPEWCLSFETNNLLTGKTLNPYDPARTPGGSSGGEAAIISSGASVVGIGSDIAGSIRIPGLFTCLFGHKPTPGYISVEGHFPNSNGKEFREQLTVGPLCRYAEDLVPLVKALAGNKASELKLDEKVELKNIRIFYALDAGNSVLGMPVDSKIKESILKAVDYLKDMHGATTKLLELKELENSMEISLAFTVSGADLPNLLQHPHDAKINYSAPTEIFKALFGWSQFSLQGLCYPILMWICSLMPEASVRKLLKKGEILKNKFIETLGTDGVFLYPTYTTPASYHSEVYVKMTGAMYAMIFNVLKMPATQVPLGVNERGLPIGFQVVAAPHQDRLCLAVARILEQGFGGWVPPPSSSSA